jgi:hypothetical protein
MNRQSIKLLVTLVLLILAATSVWMTSQADARGLSSPGASNHLSATRPGVDIAAGEPDAGSGGGIAPTPPPANQKKLSDLGWMGGRVRAGLADWINWTSRIWATLYLRAAR